MRRILCSSVILVTLMLGCSDPGSKLRGGAVATPKWDALEKLTSKDLLYPIEMSAMRNDWKGVKAAVTKPEFKAAVDAFATAEIPSEFATDARKSAKDEAVKHYRALIKEAEGKGSSKVLKAEYEAAKKSIAEVQKPDTGK